MCRAKSLYHHKRGQWFSIGRIYCHYRLKAPVWRIPKHFDKNSTFSMTKIICDFLGPLLVVDWMPNDDNSFIYCSILNHLHEFSQIGFAHSGWCGVFTFSTWRKIWMQSGFWRTRTHPIGTLIGPKCKLEFLKLSWLKVFLLRNFKCFDFEQNKSNMNRN